MTTLTSAPLRASLAIALSAAAVGPTAAQSGVRFSMDWRGPTNGPAGLSDGDVLRPGPGGPAMPASSPQIFVQGSSLGLVSPTGCSPSPGVSCGASMDAFSYGSLLFPTAEPHDGIAVHFSVDRLARGVAGAGSAVSDMAIEARYFDQGTDVYLSAWRGALPGVGTGANKLWLDGDGQLSAGGLVEPGVGLREPNRPSQRWPNASHDAGDDLDGLDVGVTAEPHSGLYFSVPNGQPDPTDPIGAPAIPSTSAALGVSGADVLYGQPGRTPSIYASATTLGLDLFGRDSDDIDALHVAENGRGGFQVPLEAFAWGSSAGDLLLFSLRRGSATVGKRDSRLGIRITEGDVLAAPRSPGLTPQIIVRAESMGLRTSRSVNNEGNDDLDALALGIDPIPFEDCNNNHVDDAEDIMRFVSNDDNMNAIPDECEWVGSGFCECSAAVAQPCHTSNEDAGCGNTVGDGAYLQSYGRLNGDLGLNFLASGLPFGATCQLYLSSSATSGTAYGSGVLCLGFDSISWLGSRSSSTSGDALGTVTFPTYDGATWTPGMAVSVGQTLYFQMVYLNPGGTCGSGVNFTNGVSVVVD